jgi:hypothetical protein
VSDDELDGRLADALRAPLADNRAARDAIMVRVRHAARERMPVRRGILPFHVRSTRHSIVGLVFAAGIGSITMLSVLSPVVASAPGHVVSSVVIGDTVVSTLRDTLRLVRLMFDDSSARHVAVVGDFNGWRPEATPMHRTDGAGRWSATLALHDGSHRYALVVDGQRMVADETSVTLRRMDGRGYATLRVNRSTD